MSTAINNSSIYAGLGLTGSGSSGSTANAAATAATSAASTQLNEQDFLQLMTTQLQDQDPLNPISNNEFFSQIAQFSTVSGIAQLNSSFGTLSSQLSSSQALDAAALIGQGVMVAGTQALMPALESWLHDLSAHPPAGFTPMAEGNGIDAVRSHTRNLGIDFAVFDGSQSGKRHDVVVMVVDPDALNAKAGPILGVVGKFKLLPQGLRDSIDAQAKKQTGFTVSDATNPDSPMGAAVEALGQLRDFGGRGVVLIDAVKQ